MCNILEVNHVTKNLKDFAIDDINFKLKKGFIMGFIGPNGAGKSTTIKLIMNLLKKDSGEIKIFGKDNIKHEVDIKSNIGFVYDNNHFIDHLSIKDNAKLIAPFYKTWDKTVFDNYIKRFELNPKKKIRKLSKGMKTKFALAIALSHHADFIIMDEPTSGLDPIFRREILDILYELIQDENKSVFFSTHITSDLDKIADYITFINKGKIVLSQTTDELYEKYTLVKGGNDILTSDVRKLFIGIKENRYGFEGLTINKNQLFDLFNDSLLYEKPMLEDIMYHYVGGNK